MKKEKKIITKTQWEAAIRKARQFVNNYAKVRWQIVDLCLSVCDYTHGGRKEASTWTASKFAREIGVDRKTLYEWIRVKRLVFDKLPKNMQAKPDAYDYSAFTDTVLQVDADSTPAFVRGVFNTVLAQPRGARKFTKYLANLSAILYNAQRPLNLKDVPEPDLIEMANRCKAIYRLLDVELRLRKRFASDDTKNKIRLGMEKISKGAGA